MTIRALDHLIGRMLSTGPKTAAAIWACRSLATPPNERFTVGDVQAGLNLWVRNGWARELGTGMYELIEAPHGETQS